jgi:hypothetical protein
MVEIKGLLFLRIEHFGKRNPPYQKTRHQSDDKENKDDAGSVFVAFGSIGCFRGNLFGFFL